MRKPQRLPYAGQPSLFNMQGLVENTHQATAKDDLMQYALKHMPPNRCIEASVRHSQDEYRCAKCGVVWALDEPRPPCLTDTSTSKG